MYDVVAELRRREHPTNVVLLTREQMRSEASDEGPYYSICGGTRYYRLPEREVEQRREYERLVIAGVYPGVGMERYQ